MDNTNRPFQLRINKNSRPFAAFSHQHDTGTNAHSSTTQTTQRRWMDSTGANAGPTKLFASSGRTEQRSSLRFKISSSAPPSDHSVDDDIASAPRRLGDGTQASGPTYGNEDSHSATPPPSAVRLSSTHARVDSRNSHPGPPPRGLRSQTDFDYDDMPDTSHSDVNQSQSGKGGKMLWQVCQHNEALEEKLAALREELEGSKIAASASSRLLHEREQDLEEKIAALAELERSFQAQKAERAAQVFDLQDQLKNALPRLSALEAENKDLTQRLLDSEERVTQAEQRAQDAERRCEQALRDTEARVALITQQAADIKTEAHIAVEEARQDALNIREEAKKRMHDLKTSMKKKVEGLSEKFTDLSSSFATVQAQRLTWDSRASELELGVGELQAAVKSSLTAMQPFLTSDAGVLKISETRELVEELQADRTSAHQVTDMLRDKLHIVSTQLVEAKDRIAELENILAEDKRRVRSSTDDLCSLGTKMEHLTDRLAKREQESREAFDDAVATGQALGEANGKIEHLTTLLAEKEAMLIHVKVLEDEEHMLQIKLDSQALDLQKLTTLRDEHARLQAKLENLCETSKESSRKLQTSEARVSDLSYELSESNLKMKACEESKEVLHLLMRERQSAAVKLEEEYRDCVSRQAVLQTQTTALEHDLATKVSDIEAHRMGNEALRAERGELQQELASLRTVREQQQRDLDKALAHLGDRASEVEVLRSERDRLQAALGQVQQALQNMDVARQSLKSKIDSLRDERDQVHAAKDEALQEQISKVQVLGATIQQLRQEVAALQERASAKNDELRRLATERDKAAGRLVELEGLRDRYDAQAKDLQNCQVDLAKIQSQFTDLKIASTANLEAASLKLQVELDRRAAMETALAASNEKLARQSQSSAVDIDQRLAQQEHAHLAIARALRERAEAAEQEATQLRLSGSEVQKDTIFGLKARVAELEQSPVDHASADGTLLAELESAKADIAVLERTVADLVQSGETLNRRYKENRLTAQEKEFVSDVMSMTNSLHEQEMVAKVNELRRRENTITALKKELSNVQGHLARLLREQRHDEPSRTVANNSIFNPKAWESSSPPTGVTQDQSTPLPVAKPSIFSPTQATSDLTAVASASRISRKLDVASVDEVKAAPAMRTPLGPSLRKPLAPKRPSAGRKPFGKLEKDAEDDDELSPIEDDDDDDGDDYVPLAPAKGKDKNKGKALLGKRSRSRDPERSPVKPATRRQRTSVSKAGTKTENKPTKQRRRG